jgi:hypothetical protein
MDVDGGKARTALEKLRTRDAEQHDWPPGERCDVLDEVEHRRFRPVQILEGDQKRPALRDPLEKTADGPEHLGARCFGVRGAGRRTEALHDDVPVIHPREDVRNGVHPAQVRDELLQRPERDPASIRKAASRGDVGDIAQLGRQLQREARLADPRRPEYADDPAPRRGECFSDDGEEHLELPSPADERGVEATRVPRGRRVDLVETKA